MHTKRHAAPAKKEPEGMERTNYFMPPEWKKQLSELASRKNTTSADLVRQAVGSMLKRHGYNK